MKNNEVALHTVVRRLAFRLASVTVGVSLLTLAVGAVSPASSVPLGEWGMVQPNVLDAATEAFVADLMNHMTLEEKVGQMIQADIGSVTPADLKQYKLGSILAGGNAAPDDNPRIAPQAWLQLTDAFYRASLSKNARHAPIPIIFGIDAVHGNAKLIGATIFPHNVGLGAAHDADLMRDIGAATAQEVASIGIDWTFAPTVAVVRDVRWGRSYESYSESPDLVAQYAAAVVEGIQGRRGTPQFMAPGHTLASVKHFIGDGGTRDGRDQGDTQISESELREVHGAAYLPAFNAGAMIVMASYNSWNGVKSHANQYLLTDVLKGRMAFQGFVVGDWNAHEQIPGCTKTDCAAAVLAGVDMLMAPDSWKKLFENTLAEAKSKVIPAARIDDAVRRILRVKTMAGLFSRPNPLQRPDAGNFARLGAAEHRALARKAVRESLVLLKNDRGVLPLNPHAHILVCGDLADDIGAQAGGWTIDWQGDHNRHADFPGATSLFAGIRAAVQKTGGSATLSVEGKYGERPDVAVVIFGERPYAEFQGDRETLQFSPADQRSLRLLTRLRSEHIPTVSVFLSGRPMWVNPEINASDAFVAAWLPGSEGEGVADVLFGSADGQPVDFSGRLSFSWPIEAMPVRFQSDGSVAGVLYPRGFGLSYRDESKVVVLNEDARVPVAYAAPPGSLYHATHPTAPWSIFLADGGEQVHATTHRAVSPHATVTAEALDEGTRVTWQGRTDGVFELSGRAQNLTVAGGTRALRFKYRLDAQPDQAVRLELFCTETLCGMPHGAQVDITGVLRHSPVGQWHTLEVPLSCFEQQGAKLDAVEVPFAIGTSGHMSLTLAEAALESTDPSAAKHCPVAS